MNSVIERLLTCISIPSVLEPVRLILMEDTKRLIVHRPQPHVGCDDGHLLIVYSVPLPEQCLQTGFGAADPRMRLQNAMTTKTPTLNIAYFNQVHLRPPLSL